MDIETILPFAAGIGILEGAEFDLAIGAETETGYGRVGQPQKSVVRGCRWRRRWRAGRWGGAGGLCSYGTRLGRRRRGLRWCRRLSWSSRRGGAALLLLLLELALQHLDALLPPPHLFQKALVGLIRKRGRGSR